MIQIYLPIHIQELHKFSYNSFSLYISRRKLHLVENMTFLIFIKYISFQTSSESLMKRKPVLERQISRTARRKSLQSPEERMLVLVLISIVILFVCCTTPAALLSIMFSSSLNGDLGFQIFRAVSNNLELVNFALNFYIYCLCSAEIRRAFLLTFLWCQQRETKPGEATALSHL